jgi:circadian clock protein KaiC
MAQIVQRSTPMKNQRKRQRDTALQKRPTGLAGFDEISGGGLPCGRATVVIGVAGTGKTVFSLQTLANAAARGEPGIFVTFEEDADSIVLNAAPFGWGLPALLENGLQIFNANVSADVVQAGDFDLGGLLSAVGALVKRSKARWIVFDAVDVLLSLLDSPASRRRELFRIQAWLKANALTCIITLKEDADAGVEAASRESLSYVADCVVHLQRCKNRAVSTRTMQISKYRGSTHCENGVPYWIGPAGIEVDPPPSHTQDYPVFNDRIPTGVERLDNMLGAGIFRGSTTLLTGAPGTSKTTLSGKFAEAACQRGERTLYICLDESPHEIARNLKSVNIDLASFEASGSLWMHGAVARQRSGDSIYTEVRGLLEALKPTCLVIDPISALRAVGDDAGVLDTVHRILQQCKMRGITTYLTSVVAKGDFAIENSDTHVSMLADTWIHLSYLVRGGERNRALTVVKARGTSHSNQVRELILSDGGVTLTDVFAEEGEVLMGSMRSQKEVAMDHARDVARREDERKVRELEAGAAELDVSIARMSRDLDERRRQLKVLKRRDVSAEKTRIVHREALAQSRGVDPPDAALLPAPPAVAYRRSPK